MGRVTDPESSSGKEFRRIDVAFLTTNNKRCGICQTKEEEHTIRKQDGNMALRLGRCKPPLSLK